MARLHVALFILKHRNKPSHVCLCNMLCTKSSAQSYVHGVPRSSGSCINVNDPIERLPRCHGIHELLWLQVRQTDFVSCKEPSIENFHGLGGTLAIQELHKHLATTTAAQLLQYMQGNTS
jgi:hypothetical protein